MTDAKKTAVKVGVSTLGRFAHSAGESFGTLLAAASATAATMVPKPKGQQESLKFEEPENLFVDLEPEAPVVEATAQAWDTANIFKATNGFFTGMVETQPFDSNSYRCKGNFTSGYDSGNRIITQSKTFATQYLEHTFQKNYIQDLSYLMKIPFGVPYSCYNGYEDIMVQDDPYEDGLLTIEEALEERIMISNQFVTNVFFNAGYMYQDVVSI